MKVWDLRKSLNEKHMSEEVLSRALLSAADWQHFYKAG